MLAMLYNRGRLQAKRSQKFVAYINAKLDQGTMYGGGDSRQLALLHLGSWQGRSPMLRCTFLFHRSYTIFFKC